MAPWLELKFYDLRVKLWKNGFSPSFTPEPPTATLLPASPGNGLR